MAQFAQERILGHQRLPVVSHKEQEKQVERVPPNFAALSGLHEKMVSRVEVEMRRRSRVERVDRVEARRRAIAPR